MAHIFLAVFLLVFGINIIAGLSLPPLVLGVLALIAGIMLLVERARLRPRP